MTREQVERKWPNTARFLRSCACWKAAQVGSDKTLSDYCKCYDFWQKHAVPELYLGKRSCATYPAHQAGIHGAARSFRSAVYREVDGQPCVMELIQQLDSGTLIDPKTATA